MNKKKLLALLMALVMTLTLVPVTAFATETTYAARIGETQYTTAQAALDAAKDDDTVTLYTGNHGDLYLRCTDENSASVDLSDWSGNGDVERFRSLKNVTIEGQEGAIVSKLTFETGMKPAGENSQSKNVLGYMDVDNLTIRGITFKPTDTVMTIGDGNDRLDIDGLTFDNCAVIDSEDSSNGSRLLYAVLTHGTSAYSYSNDNVSMNITDGLDNLTIKKCTFTNLYQVAEIRETNGFAFTNNNISGTRKQTLLLTKNANYSVSGTVSITDNTETGRKSERFMRITGSAAQMTVTGNSVSGYQGDTDTFKATDSGADATYTLNNNSWMSQDDMTAYGAGKINIDKWPVKVAEVNGVQYATLEAAFANAQDGDTITLLANCSGNGIKAPQGKFGTNGLTVDFANHTYTVDGETVGSTGTETNGFQLLKNNKITFRNGTITSAKAKILVQNYSNLTLDGMTLTLNNPNYTGAYTLSNNNGNVVIDGTTINANPAGGFAFDVCRYSSYPSVSVTVQGNSVINGDIEVDAGSGNAMNGMHLTLTSGTHTGSISLTDDAKTALANDANASIVKAVSFVQAAPAGYLWEACGEGTVKLAKSPNVAMVDNVEYDTLEAALAAAPSGGTVTLINDINFNAIYTERNARDYGRGHEIDLRDLTLDMGGHTIKTINATVTFGGNGATIKNGTFKLVPKNTDGSYKDGSYALIIDNNVNVNTHGASGTVLVKDVTCEGGINLCSADVTLDNVTASTTPTKFYAVWAEQNAKVTILSGTYTLNNGGNGVLATGTGDEGGAKIYVTGGNYNDGNKLVYSNSASDSIQITGGKFSTNPSAYVADGYEAVSIDASPYFYQVGKVKATDLTPQAGATETSATYEATKKVVDSTDPETVLATGTTFTVTVDAPTENLGATKEAVQLSNIDVDEVVSVAVDKASEKSQTKASVTVQLAKDESAQVVAVDETTKKVTFEVHPEAIITVKDDNDVQVGAATTVKLSNDQIKGAFSFKLTIPTDLAAAGKKVTVIHKHSDNTEENLGAFTVANDHTITLTGISSFSEFIATSVSEGDVTVGAVGASLRRRVLISDHRTVVNTSTDYRVTFDWTDTESKVNVSESYLEWSNNDGATWHKVSIANSAALDGGVTRASVVITGIPSTAFSTTIKTRIHLATSGNAIEAYGPDYSVNVVADKLSKLTGNETWSEYGRYLLGTRTEPLYVNN